MMINFQIWSSLILIAVLQESRGQLLLIDEPNQNCDDCIDIPPDNIWTCEQQADWGKCDRFWMTSNNFCAKTCGRCSCNQDAPVSTSAQVIISPWATQQLVIPESARPASCDCDDIPPNQWSSCEQQKKWGRCERNWMKATRASAPNGYCASTCGRCVCESVGEDCFCTDITPSGSPFDCPTQRRYGKCEASWMLSTQEDPNGYCQISCGRCTCRPKEQEEDPCDVLREHGNGVSIIRVSSIAVSNVETATAASLSSAIAEVQGGSTDAVSAAQKSSEAIGLAVADAVASVTISGCTQGDNSRASGFGSAESAAFAQAAGTAVSDSFASAGSSQVALNASTFEQVVKTALAYAQASVDISGDAEVNIISSTVSSAVACVLAESLSKAFAKIDNTIVQSVATVKECPPQLINQLTGLTTDQQLFTSPVPTPTPTPATAPTTAPTPTPSSSSLNAGVCVDVQPSSIRRTCQYVAARDRCDQVKPGECEKSCGKCQA